MRVNFNKVWQADIAGEVYFSRGGSNQHKLLSFCHLLCNSEGIVSILDHKPHLLGRNEDVSCHFLQETGNPVTDFHPVSDQQTLLESEGAVVLDSFNSAGGLIQGAVFPLYKDLHVADGSWKNCCSPY